MGQQKDRSSSTLCTPSSVAEAACRTPISTETEHSARTSDDVSERVADEAACPDTTPGALQRCLRIMVAWWKRGRGRSRDHVKTSVELKLSSALGHGALLTWLLRGERRASCSSRNKGGTPAKAYRPVVICILCWYLATRSASRSPEYLRSAKECYRGDLRSCGADGHRDR